MKNQLGFFDFAAEVGLTKHIGGIEVTEALIQLCHIGKDSYVLDVGSGVGDTVQSLTSDAWAGLLEAAGLTEITVRSYTINTQDEARGILRRYGWGGMLGVMGRMLLLYVISPAYRKFVKGVRKGGVTPENLEEYFGDGLFVRLK